MGGRTIKNNIPKVLNPVLLYVNSPSREVDKITKMAVFSHGIVNEGGTIKLGYSTHNNELDIDKDVIKNGIEVHLGQTRKCISNLVTLVIADKVLLK